ncbi:hypothetical protein GQ54DRAFT_258360, partial [Martensiomyces pterosporus]
MTESPPPLHTAASSNGRLSVAAATDGAGDHITAGGGAAPNKASQDSSGGGADALRYLRACDNCRRRKVKCDGGKPSCAHCRRVGASCHYSIKPKSR